MSTATDKRKALGKGLSALLPAKNPVTPSAPPTPAQETSAKPTLVPIDKIAPNPTQPRTTFDQTRLEELAQSIRANGIIQPLIIRHKDNHYELVAGERRWRAARIAGLESVPVVIQDFATDRLLEVALIENIQREDLNAIEAAQAFDRLAREHGLSHEDIGRRTGKDRSSIANTIRLLKLPPSVQTLVAEGRLPAGQARAILGLTDPEAQAHLANKAVAQGLSTRQVESYVRQLTDKADPRNAKEKAEPAVDPNVKAAVSELERVLGTRVRIVEHSPQRGRIEIEYYSQDDLDRVYSQIVREN